jgi:hypothetical protein
MRMKLAVVLSLVLAAACGSDGKSSLGVYAVGTYIGGGSIFGADDCTYEGGPSVFQSSDEPTPSSTPAKGPRFITNPGRIVVRCPKTELAAVAAHPTGATMTGPKTLKRGAKSDIFMAQLVANKQELRGEANIEWQLGSDCAGIATFSPVLGAQDTGGRDRTRTLEPIAAGKCTVIATLTTGSTLYPSFAPKAFQTQTLVTVQ